MLSHSYTSERNRTHETPLSEAAISFTSSAHEMGSTDTADDNHCAGGSSCGLVSSLFPTICRGRAEAFARRLHRRLTSLNGTDADTNYEEDDDDNDDETSVNENQNLKKSTTGNPGTNQRQPCHAPDSDLYYDLSSDLENAETETGSPDQELSAAELATLLVNHTNNLQPNRSDTCRITSNIGQLEKENILVHRNLEPGYGFSTPLNGTPSDDCNSEIFFDPVCSDTDKTRSDSFYDPINSSEVSNDKTESDSHKLPGRRRADLQKLQNTQDTSESSSSVNGNLQQNKLNNKHTVENSSEESLDAASSLDTTSPSHESLWSTFDESDTVSLQNDSLSSSLPGHPVIKSHSDSEIIPRVHLPTVNIESASSSDEVDFINQNNHTENRIKLPPLVSHIAISYNDLSAASTGDSCSTDTSSNDLPSAFVVDFLRDDKLSPTTNNFRSENSEIIDAVNDLRLQEISSPHNNAQAISKEKIINNIEMIEDKEDEEKDDADEEDEGEEKERPQRIRRCSSLKTGKTPPGTPGRKKIVRFADVLGLDLADVRTFLDEIPKVPNSAFSDLIYDDIFQKDSSPVPYDNFSRSLDSLNSISVAAGTGLKPSGVLVPLFQQPGGLINFLDIIREQQVCLENVIVQDPVSICIQGTVRVRNLDFHKSVHIRYSLDSWKSYSDLQALYLQNSCDGFSDKFSFQLYCRPLKVGAKLELAVRFQCKGVQYWDNNSGLNYCFQCLPTSQASNYIPITSSRNSEINDWSMNFY